MGVDHVEDDTLFEEAGTGSERDNMDMVKTTFSTFVVYFSLILSIRFLHFERSRPPPKHPSLCYKNFMSRKELTQNMILFKLKGLSMSPLSSIESVSVTLSVRSILSVKKCLDNHVNILVAMGSGQSKKKAKHAAAKAVLDKILGGRCASLLQSLNGSM